jgi:hypothetical protein
MLRRAAAALPLLGLLTSSAPAQYRIVYDEGGVIDAYIEKYNALRNGGATVVLDGMCLSSCALIVGLLERGQVCVTPRARLGFHSAYELLHGARRHDTEATRMYFTMLPAPMRAILNARGWDGASERREMICVEGDELLAFFRAC